MLNILHVLLLITSNIFLICHISFLKYILCYFTVLCSNLINCNFNFVMKLIRDDIYYNLLGMHFEDVLAKSANHRHFYSIQVSPKCTKTSTCAIAFNYVTLSMPVQIFQKYLCQVMVHNYIGKN